MVLQTRSCPRCGRASVAPRRDCALCGTLLDGAESGEPRGGPSGALPASRAEWRIDEELEEERAPWKHLALGLPIALLLAFAPLARYMGWFLASLVHEMGHAGAAWLCGMPAVPVIRLDGHAAAVHQEQRALLVLLVAGGLVWGAWRLAPGPRRKLALGLAGLGYPLLALTPLRELLHLSAGHLAELAFAALAFARALTGAATSGRAERALYAGLGWYLLGSNLALSLGLAFSAGARLDYASSGSFGLTNDYLRIAGEILGWPVGAVGLAASLPALALLAGLGLALARPLRDQLPASRSR